MTEYLLKTVSAQPEVFDVVLVTIYIFPRFSLFFYSYHRETIHNIIIYPLANIYCLHVPTYFKPIFKLIKM